MPVIPANAAQCCARLREHGYAAYLVGGCVRDMLLGRIPEDWDVATSARPEQVVELFENTIPTGLKHGTVTIVLEGGCVEVTTFRREEGYADGRHPDAVSFDVGLQEDLARRDFTINAMAFDQDGSIIDPFGGQDDLERKRIRCVGDPAARFHEDALRMLRAVRFSAQLGFELEEATAAAVMTCAHQVAQLSVERVRTEVEKTIIAPYPERGAALFSMGLLSPWLVQPAIPDLNSLNALPRQPVYRWSGLCVRLGGTELLEKLKPDRHTVSVCAQVLRALEPPLPRAAADWRRRLASYGTEVTTVAAAIAGMGEQLERVLVSEPCYEVSRLAITGGELLAMGFQGVAIGNVQRQLLDHVLDHPEDNNKQTLQEIVKQLD